MNLPPIIGLILNYRDAVRTDRCIRSLLNDGMAHVLIWDNSEDEGISANTLRKLLDSEDRVTIEISPVNLGFAAGVNHGLTWITTRFSGSWALLINNDAVLLPGGSFTLCQVLSKTPVAVIAYPTIDHGGRLIGTAYYQRHLGLITTTPLPASVPHASGCCLLIAPERMSSPLFDEDFFHVRRGCRTRLSFG
ncbi:glycosyltransferase family 2 protein [Candidatus Competibacter phosphatis]|uniref:Glycosyltransferase family 2 protein n=1 Tax=Candidatus Competibacter phosphatis TaxID=221280 RepID=A0ABX1TI85_9GAMM|nr:glycosyltransferase [Candidatus Competibacter phosphatis]NMQ17819.1 glycosyltransferase family 2 protein [Candidatus Competibacter phosphatis]